MTTETEERLKILAASQWEAVQMIARRMQALYGDTRDADENAALIDGPELLAVLAPLLELCEATLNLATQQNTEHGLHAASGMGARLVDRAMGPSTDELTAVLSATEHALQKERARVGWLAGLALSVINSLPDDERAVWIERHGARLQALIDRDAPHEDPDATPGAGGTVTP